MVEDTQLVSTIKDQNGEDVEENEIETLAQVPVYENVRAPGSDVRKGDLALEKGTRVSGAGGEIGTLAFVGRTEASLLVRVCQMAVIDKLKCRLKYIRNRG